MRYFLGIDIGGTKSHALIADETGRAVGFGTGAAGNHEVVGYDGLTARLTEITDQALASAGIDRAQIAGAGFGVAGYDWPSELAPTLDAIAVLNLPAQAAGKIEVVNDTIIGLVAGAEAGWGVALVAGTSNNCWGWDAQHRIGRVTGNGAIFGEYGGAGEMVWKALAAVAAAWTRRGPATALTDAFMAYCGATSAADLLEGLSQETYDIYAAAAPLVFETAQAGDAVAQDVIRWTAQEAGSLVNGVIRQLGLEEATFDVVQVGSLYKGGPLFLAPLVETVHALAPAACFVPLTVPPVVGAVLLGVQQVGPVTSAVRQTLIESIRDFLDNS